MNVRILLTCAIIRQAELMKWLSLPRVAFITFPTKVFSISITTHQMFKTTRLQKSRESHRPQNCRSMIASIKLDIDS